jgi:hypothetical protein
MGGVRDDAGGEKHVSLHMEWRKRYFLNIFISKYVNLNDLTLLDPDRESVSRFRSNDQNYQINLIYQTFKRAFCTYADMFITYIKYLYFSRKNSTFLTSKSNQDPDPDPDPHWFTSLDPDPDT